MQAKNLEGMRFGSWAVLSRAENNADGRAMWNCKCDCGTRRAVLGKTLLSGKSKCCGCTRKESAAEASRKANTRHGMKNMRLYTIWHSMKGRVHCPSTHSYERYGGRGIKICKEWESDFKLFADWALSHGYADNLTLDRINPDGDYTPDNCRWATWSEQARNKSAVGGGSNGNADNANESAEGAGG